MFNAGLRALEKVSERVTFKNGKACRSKKKIIKKKIPNYTKIVLKSAMLCNAVAGKAGLAVYIYLKWMRDMNHKKKGPDYFYPISNDWLEKNYKTTRQSKYIAMKKLREAGYIDFLDREDSGGGLLRAKLNLGTLEDEE